MTAQLELATDNGILTSPDPAQSPLAIRGMTVSYNDTPVVFSVDMTARAGAMTAIVGPNGAGKSTLLKAALGIVKPLSGVVTVFGQPMKAAKHRIAYVPQRASVDWDFPTEVLDVVMMGQFRKLGLFRRARATDRNAALACLDRVGMAEFANRQIGQLSGGQQQRVFLARALAQEADIFLLDEPFAGVDAATERAIIDVLKSLRDEGKSVIAVHHDLTTLDAYFDDVFLLNRRKIAEGPIAQSLTQEALQATYGGRLSTAALPQVQVGA